MSASDSRRGDRASARWIAVIAAVGILAAVVGVLAADASAGDWSDLWLEVAKAGVQVVAVGVAGGALAAAWKTVTEHREAEARRRDKIRAEFAELVVLYNGVKTVRRALRSLGLDAKLHIAEEDRSRVEGYYTSPDGLHDLARVGRAVELTQEQADGFHEQMQALNSLQLGYEAKARQFEQADLLRGDKKLVEGRLRKIESYLNDLVDLWEEHGWRIRPGTQLHLVSTALQPLFRQDLFKPAFSERMTEITKVINAHLFGSLADPDPEKSASAGRSPSDLARPVDRRG